MTICQTPDTQRFNPAEGNYFRLRFTAGLQAEPEACPHSLSAGIIAEAAGAGMDLSQEARVLKPQIIGMLQAEMMPAPMLVLDHYEANNR